MALNVQGTQCWREERSAHGIGMEVILIEGFSSQSCGALFYKNIIWGTVGG